jgi:hypothetical protein
VRRALALALLFAPLWAQAEEVKDRVLDRRAGLSWALLGIGAASLTTGALLVAQDDDFRRGMSVPFFFFGANEVGISAYSLLKLPADRRREAPMRFWQDEEQDLRTTAIVSLIADLAYSTAGFLMWRIADNDVVRGVGAGILIQRGAILVFDATSLMVLRGN